LVIHIRWAEGSRLGGVPRLGGDLFFKQDGATLDFGTHVVVNARKKKKVAQIALGNNTNFRIEFK